MTDQDQTFRSYAQHGEDVILWRALGDRENVVYVDVGAYHPTYDSVTRALYERGWRGVNIEPQPDRIAAFDEQRPEDTNLAIAIGEEDGTITLTVPDNEGWASVLEPSRTGADPQRVRQYSVPVRRLDTLLPELGIHKVDVLKVDVEGSEPAVVRGLLGGEVRPSVCVVEGVAPGVGRAAGDEAVELLVDAGYRHCLFDGLNHYLTIEPDLEEPLSYPASPIDGYVTDLVERLMQERAEHLAELDHLRSEVARRVAAPAGPWIDQDERRARRAEMFTRLLAVGPTLPPTSIAEDECEDLLEVLASDFAPDERVVHLYRTVLRREVDPPGLAAWADELASGRAPAVEVAAALARSKEAMRQPFEHRLSIQEDLETWRCVEAAVALGMVEPLPGVAGATEPDLAERIYVRALFEVIVGRQPVADELEHEVSKLRSGCGREWMLRAFAERPEAWRRIEGEGDGGGRDQLARRWHGRHHLQVLRDLVLAAEGRELARIRARAVRCLPRLRALPIAHEGSRA